MTPHQIVPITRDMLAPANEFADMPRADFPVDWQGGIVGNDVDIASTTLATASAAGPGLGSTSAYEPRTQADKAELMGIDEVVADIGVDYGDYHGETSRDGDIRPFDPYPHTEDTPIADAFLPSQLAAEPTPPPPETPA